MKLGPFDIPNDAVVERFVRASGPGGQNVNKVATAVELRFDIAASGLPEAVAARLLVLAGSRATQSGEIVIFADEFRSQVRNREAARERLAALVAAAAQRRKRRIATKPTRASKERRIEAKTRRGDVKRLRGRGAIDD